MRTFTKRTRRPSYTAAIEWIVEYDDVTAYDTVHELSGAISVAMIADLFGANSLDVAKDVWFQAHGTLVGSGLS